MTARERLEEILGGKVENDHEGDLLGHIADRLLAAGVTLPPAPTSPPLVWPGLEGEGLERAAGAFLTAYSAASGCCHQHNDARRAAYTAEAAHLWRAMVASLPSMPDLLHPSPWVSVEDWPVSRAALAALADPYDGGGK